MLKGVPEIISAKLIKVMMDMGHGDELVICDGNFRTASLGLDESRIVDCSGHNITQLLDAMLALMPLDAPLSGFSAVLCMDAPEDLRPNGHWDACMAIVKKHEPQFDEFSALNKADFYERAKSAFAFVKTSDKTRFANIIIRKGLVR